MALLLLTYYSARNKFVNSLQFIFADHWLPVFLYHLRKD